MKKEINLINLYDYYGELLTEKQQNYFVDYFFNDLTLQEISENNNVSRNAVHKQIKESEAKLNFYEEKLKLITNKNKINKLIENIDGDLKKRIEELI
ncbi:MAG: sigma factor-like helix-turn-helix DNA-binding protein [Mycoplasmatota bacterium]